MKKRSSKLVALLLALAMVLGLSMSASAANRSAPDWDDYWDNYRDYYDFWGDDSPDPHNDPWYYDPWTETYDPYSDLFWVSLDDSYMSMNVGDESFLVASGYGGYPSYRYSWSTDNSSVVRITRGSNSDTVWLSAVGNGTTRVRCTARDSNGNSDTAYCEVSVYGNRYSVTSVDVSPRDVTLPAYSSRSIDVSVSDSRADYSVTWTSSNTNIATVSGSSTRATITSKGAAGTATITASVRDRVSGTTRTDTCRVTVEVEKNATYNPSTTLTIGSTTRGTAIYDSLRNQYQSVYGTTLPDSATISFGSSTNGNIATRHLGNGTAISANTNYTMSQYRDMYTEPLGSGNFITPYTIKYNNNNLSGNITIQISAASVSASLPLAANAPYTFSEATAFGTGTEVIAAAIRNAMHLNSNLAWSYLRFSSSSGPNGTLYLNSTRSALTPNTNVTAANIGSLYFVPAAAGAFTTTFTAYSSGGNALASGVLTISIPDAAMTPTPTTVPNGVIRCIQSTQAVAVNGMVKPTFEVYNVNDENYFKLRDIAMLLNGTGSQYAVGYDAVNRVISVTTGQPYVANGTELVLTTDKSATCAPSTMSLMVNNVVERGIQAYTFQAANGNLENFFRLRDLAPLMNFIVDYNDTTRTILITSR